MAKKRFRRHSTSPPPTAPAESRTEKAERPFTYSTPAEEESTTLAAMLRRRMEGRSWSQVRQLIESRHVQVNGNLCTDAGRRLKSGDVVKFFPHSLARPPRENDVQIRYLDAHLVVVEKPAGMTTLRHSEERNWSPRRRQFQPTLDEVLPRLLAKRSGRSGRPMRVRAVHRLDRDTSGLMVFARTAQAEQALVGMFRRHDIERAYRAIVHGQIEAQTIETWIVRDRGDGRRGSDPRAAAQAGKEGERPPGTPRHGQGQRAVTHVRPLESLGAYSVVECRLETGRTHQIRIHLSEAGNRLCGETTYNRPWFPRGAPSRKEGETPRFAKPLEDHSGAPRLALHAYILGFQHPVSGEMLRFESQWPPDLAEFLARLRGGQPEVRKRKPSGHRPPSEKS